MSTYSDPTVTSVNQSSRPQPLSVLVFVAGLLAVALAAFFYWQTTSDNSDTTSSNTTLSQEQAQIASLKPVSDQLTQYSATAQSLHSLLDNQKNWPTILDTIAAHLYKHMAVTTLQLSDQGTVTLTGTTSDFTDYAAIFTSLTSPDVAPYFSAVKPTGVSKTAASQDGKTPEQISFGFDITLNPAILK